MYTHAGRKKQSGPVIAFGLKDRRLRFQRTNRQVSL
jgi:hypothetical protein